MAREIDLTKPLTEAEVAYINQRPWLKDEIALIGGDVDAIMAGTPMEPAEDDTEGGDIDYASFAVPLLRAELAERGLDTSGKKAELIARLEEDDELNEAESEE